MLQGFALPLRSELQVCSKLHELYSTLFLEYDFVDLRFQKRSYSKYSIFLRNRVCIAPRANGKSCGPDSDCASGHCCGVWPFKRCRECCKDPHCSGGKFCLSRTCRDCLQENQSGCSSDGHCCGQLTCCGEKKFLGIILSRGTCQDPNLPCCAMFQQPCSTSPAAPETMKCCNASCQQDFSGSYRCL